MPSRTTCESFQPSRRSSSRRSRSVCTSRRAWMIRDMSRSVYVCAIVSHWPDLARGHSPDDAQSPGRRLRELDADELARDVQSFPWQLLRDPSSRTGAPSTASPLTDRGRVAARSPAGSTEASWGAPVDTQCRDNLCGRVHGKPIPAAVTDGEPPAHARGGMRDQLRRAVRTLSVALFLLGWQGASMLNVRRQFHNLQKIMGRNRYQLQIDDALLVSMDSQTEFLHNVGFLRSAPKARTYVEPRFLREVDPGLVKIQ